MDRDNIDRRQPSSFGILFFPILVSLYLTIVLALSFLLSLGKGMQELGVDGVN
jgi:hypothetical protein